MAEMKAEIKGKNLIITVPMEKKPRPSKSGNTLIVATSHGNKELACKVEGQNIRVGVNAYIYPD
jgi:polysaccharide deacetylase 2 family uncharacterized protein YibQ